MCGMGSSSISLNPLSLCEGFGLLDKVMGSSKSKSTLWLDRVELQLLIEEWSFECSGHMPQMLKRLQMARCALGSRLL